MARKPKTAPVAETPAIETPAIETPAPETPAIETPAPETPAPTFLPVSFIYQAGFNYGMASHSAGKRCETLATHLKAEFGPRLNGANCDDAKASVSREAYVEAGEGVVIAYMQLHGVAGYDHSPETAEGDAVRRRVREWLRCRVHKVDGWNKALSEAEKTVFKNVSAAIGRALKAAGIPNPNPRAPRASQENTGDGATGGTPEAEKVVAVPANIKAPVNANGAWLAEMVAFITQRSKEAVAKEGEAERAFHKELCDGLAAYQELVAAREAETTK